MRVPLLTLLENSSRAVMDDISRLLGSIGRIRSDTVSSDATQSTGSRLALRHRLNQLMTCVDDLDPKNELHDKVVKTLDSAFLACGKRAYKPKKDSFRWRMTSSLFFLCLLCVLKLKGYSRLKCRTVIISLSIYFSVFFFS